MLREWKIEDFSHILELANENAITEWDMEFVASMEVKFDQFGDNMFLSQKQHDVLMRLTGGEI